MISNRQKQIDWEESIEWNQERAYIEAEYEQEYQKLKAELNKEKVYINGRIVKQPRFVTSHKTGVWSINTPKRKLNKYIRKFGKF